MIFLNQKIQNASQLFLQYLFIESDARLLPGNTKSQRAGFNLDKLVEEVKDLEGGYSHDVLEASLDSNSEKTVAEWQESIKAYLKVKKLRLKDIVFFGAIHSQPRQHVHLIIANK